MNTNTYKFLPLFIAVVLFVGFSPTSDAEVTAKLFISPAGNSRYLVVVNGHASQVNARVGVRVMGDDTWFDDFLFNMGIGSARTDFAGNFNLSRTVHRSVLNEDWGRDEIYAVAEVSSAGSTRTNTIRKSF